jgi:D-glycero-alpha-D-manno-heptose 1-phosphate guanylyltransferase
MKLLVLAGGFGTRLKSVVDAVPKALAPVGDVPFLHLQIEHWKKQGVKSFVFLLHHQADLVINYLKTEQNGLLKECELQWMVEPTPMDTGGAVAYAVEQLNLSGDFLVTNADTWLGTGVQDVCLANAPAMAVVQLNDASRYGCVQLDDQNNVTAFHEKSNSKGPGWINAGLCHLNADWFKGWNHLPFSLERISFPAMANRGELKAVVLQADFIDIGIPDDYFRFCCWIAAGCKGTLCS